MPTVVPSSPVKSESLQFFRKLSLQHKALITTILCVVAISSLLSLGVLNTFSHSFSRLETQAVDEASERIRRAIQFDLSELERSARDYANWGETYDFVSHPSDNYILSNLSESVLSNLKIDQFLIFTNEGLLVAGRTPQGIIRQGDARAKALQDMMEKPLLVCREKQAPYFRGLLATSEGILLYACLPIHQDNGQGDRAGILVHAHRLNENAMDELRSITNLQLQLIPSAVIAPKNRITQRVKTIENDQWLSFIHPLEDMDGQQIGTIRARMERQIHQHGKAAMQILITGILVTSCLAGITILWLMRSLVTNRLERLHQEVRRIGRKPDLNARVSMQGEDEIAELADEINRMLSALHQAEARQKQSKEESEHLQQQLQQVQKMEAIGAMAGGLAHDFNNMLNSILGSADLLQFELPPDHPSQEHIRRIEKAGINAAAIVRQLLAVSRRQTLKTEIIHLGTVTREALDLIRASLPRSIEINFACETSRDTILADSAQLQQVLINLATNAAHAMAGKDKACLNLQLEAASIPDNRYPETTKLLPGNYVRLSINDNGCGIPPENQLRIFEPFFTTKPSGSGSGLGLAVVHAIIAKHNGSIGLLSTPGAGSTFTIHLPLSNEMPTQPERAKAMTEPPRPLAILMVDDDRLVLDTLAGALRRLGQEVRGTSSCEEALRILSDPANSVDVLITDQFMPGMTGLELGMHARELRGDLPMILISGHAAVVDSHMIHDRGFARILLKPMKPAQLLEAAREVFLQKN